VNGLRRIVWVITVVVWFMWFGYEDHGLSSVIAVAALLAFALGLEGFSRWTQKRPATPTTWLLRSIIIGAVAGALVGPITVLIALVKVFIYSQSSPDFDLTSIRIVVGQSLTWIAAGALFGAAGGFLKLSQKR
jgi:hypothetical protein